MATADPSTTHVARRVLYEGQPVTTPFDPTPKRLSILVVDDHHDGADSTADLLTLYGHAARAVYTAADALTEMARRPADAVVAEVRLREADGYALARRLSRGSRRPLLVAVTGAMNAGDRCRAAGFDHVFVKPADPASLARVLSDHADALRNP